MPHPMNFHRAELFSDITLLKPAGVLLRVLEDVCINVDEE